MRVLSQILFMSFAVSMFFTSAESASAEAHSTPGSHRLADHSSRSVCNDTNEDSATRAVLDLVCRRKQLGLRQVSSAEVIVVGFVGGFAKPNDGKHPEVLFADYLEEHYGSNVHAEVFSNHDEKGALHYVLNLLDTNHDGVLSDQEKRNARLIIYGHSWGASQTAIFARELGLDAIPVLLTIQLDIIPKFGQKPIQISTNVQRAVNFYQARGLLRGQTEIRAESARTQIIGNFRMSYTHMHVNCSNYSWFARTFNKPHHEIENDPNVWKQIDSLIDAEVSGADDANFAAGSRPTVARSFE